MGQSSPPKPPKLSKQPQVDSGFHRNFDYEDNHRKNIQIPMKRDDNNKQHHILGNSVDGRGPSPSWKQIEVVEEDWKRTISKEGLPRKDGCSGSGGGNAKEGIFHSEEKDEDHGCHHLLTC